MLDNFWCQHLECSYFCSTWLSIHAKSVKWLPSLQEILSVKKHYQVEMRTILQVPTAKTNQTLRNHWSESASKFVYKFGVTLLHKAAMLIVQPTCFQTETTGTLAFEVSDYSEFLGPCSQVKTYQIMYMYELNCIHKKISLAGEEWEWQCTHHSHSWCMYTERAYLQRSHQTQYQGLA